MKETNSKNLKSEIIKKHEVLFAKRLELESEASRLMLEINLLDARNTLDKVSQLNQKIDDITSEMDYLKQALEAINWAIYQSVTNSISITTSKLEKSDQHGRERTVRNKAY